MQRAEDAIVSAGAAEQVVDGQPLVIVADDHQDFRRALQYRLESWGCRVKAAADRAALLRALQEEAPAAVLLDLYFGDHNGVEVLAEILQIDPRLSVVLLTGHGSIEIAVHAIKSGAYDFLTKPPDLQRLRLILEHILERRRLTSQLESLHQMVEGRLGDDGLLGVSPAIQSTRKLIASIAGTDATVLILGESGSGKELAARALHRRSGRAGRFVAMNMAAVPQELAESMLFGHEKGAFTGADRQRVGCCEEADQGTLFLDEIGELASSLQAKLLRFLQERTIVRIGASRPTPLDVRIIAATHRDLATQIREGRFRDDLYYRLHEIPLRLPPLRERAEDVPLLANHFLHRAVARFRRPPIRIADDAMEILQKYSWPGNVRELENLIHRLVLLTEGDWIALEALPSELFGPSAEDAAPTSAVRTPASNGTLRLQEIEKETICEALRECRGQVGEAAHRLGLSAATLYRKIKRLNLPIEDFRC